ncbi:MAG: glycosyltransferase family 4 protein [Elusimicrobiota bacterium]
MNIVHLEDEPWDSGIAHYALTLAGEQARRGHRVAFWGRSSSPILARARELGLAARGGACGALGWLSLPVLRGELAAFSPRIVNAHTGSAHALAVALAPRGAAVVRTRGDARPPRSNALTRWTAARTAVQIAANSSLKADLESCFPSAAVRLVPQGIEGLKSPTPMPAVPVVGMIARLDPVKGHDVLLDAALALKSQVSGLRIACAGEGSQFERLSARIRDEGLEGTAMLLGRVPEPWKFLSACRIGVVASLGSEAVSRAALEWMSAGRPVVATRVGGITDLVVDGVTGLLIPPGDAGALSAAIKALLADSGRATLMGRAGRELWEKNYSLAPFYLRTQEVYEEALRRLPR